jgi:hypothetical protein
MPAEPECPFVRNNSSILFKKYGRNYRENKKYKEEERT